MWFWLYWYEPHLTCIVSAEEQQGQRDNRATSNMNCVSRGTTGPHKYSLCPDVILIVLIWSPSNMYCVSRGTTGPYKYSFFCISNSYLPDSTEIAYWFFFFNQLCQRSSSIEVQGPWKGVRVSGVKVKIMTMSHVDLKIRVSSVDLVYMHYLTHFHALHCSTLAHLLHLTFYKVTNM